MPRNKYAMWASSVYMDYQKTSHLRPRPDHFRNGLARARTILNAPPAPVKSHTNADISISKSVRKAPPLPVYETVPRPLIPRMPDYESYRGARMEILMERRAYERQLRVKATMRADESFLHDKRFLDMIFHNTSGKTSADMWVRGITKDALEYIDTRNIFWQQQIPAHMKQASKNLIRELKNKPAQPRTQAVVEKAVKELERITQMMSHAHYNRAIKAAKKLIEDLNKLETRISGVEYVLANCSSILGNAYLEKKDEKKALAFHMQDLKFGTDYNIPAVRSRALDNLGRVYARIGQFQKAIQVWSEKLEFDEDMPLSEKVWLCHELGYCHLKLGNHKKARECGEMCYQTATEIPDKMWQLNASMLVAQAMVVSGDLYGCKQAFDKALKAAVKAASMDILRVTKGDKDAEKTVLDTLEELNTAIDSYKEKEQDAKSHEAIVPIEKSLERGRSRFKGKDNRSRRGSSFSGAASTKEYDRSKARAGSLAPIKREPLPSDSRMTSPNSHSMKEHEDKD